MSVLRKGLSGEWTTFSLELLPFRFYFSPKTIFNSISEACYCSVQSIKFELSVRSLAVDLLKDTYAQSMNLNVFSIAW
jgi:hypothetical protein